MDAVDHTAVELHVLREQLFGVAARLFEAVLVDTIRVGDTVVAEHAPNPVCVRVTRIEDSSARREFFNGPNNRYWYPKGLLIWKKVK